MGGISFSRAQPELMFRVLAYQKMVYGIMSQPASNDASHGSTRTCARKGIFGATTVGKEYLDLIIVLRCEMYEGTKIQYYLNEDFYELVTKRTFKQGSQSVETIDVIRKIDRDWSDFDSAPQTTVPHVINVTPSDGPVSMSHNVMEYGYSPPQPCDYQFNPLASTNGNGSASDYQNKPIRSVNRSNSVSDYQNRGNPASDYQNTAKGIFKGLGRFMGGPK